MAGIEFFGDDPGVDAHEPTPAPRSRRRRRLQPALVAVLALAGAGVLVFGTRDDPGRTVRPAPVAPQVHIYHYTPWHQRAIPYGGGAYIY